MRENRTYGSEGGEARAFPTPIEKGPFGESTSAPAGIICDGVLRPPRRQRVGVMARPGCCVTVYGQPVSAYSALDRRRRAIKPRPARPTTTNDNEAGSGAGLVGYVTERVFQACEPVLLPSVRSAAK